MRERERREGSILKNSRKVSGSSRLLLILPLRLFWEKAERKTDGEKLPFLICKSTSRRPRWLDRRLGDFRRNESPLPGLIEGPDPSLMNSA